MFTFFISLQSVLLVFMLLHDWVSIPPFNDIKTLKRFDSTRYRLIGSLVNGFFILAPLVLTLLFFQKTFIPIAVAFTVVAFYFVLTLGTILSWWIPYLFGSSKHHKEQFEKFKKTHHFLPLRKNHIVPNTLHVILHLQIWTCLGVSIYYLIYLH